MKNFLPFRIADMASVFQIGMRLLNKFSMTGFRQDYMNVSNDIHKELKAS